MGDSVGQTQAFFNFLETHSLAKILAEPHLLANSGEEAEFLSGGEIPIVIAQALKTSIEFGTSVTFVLTVIGADEIEMAVRPEVFAARLHARRAGIRLQYSSLCPTAGRHLRPHQEQPDPDHRRHADAHENLGGGQDKTPQFRRPALPRRPVPAHQLER